MHKKEGKINKNFKMSQKHKNLLAAIAQIEREKKCWTPSDFQAISLKAQQKIPNFKISSKNLMLSWCDG